MGKESPEGWPVIDHDFKVNDADVIPDGFSPAPDRYKIPQAPERTNIEPDSDTLNNLSSPVPRVEDPNRVGQVYAEEGQQSIKPITNSGYVTEEKIPDSFLTPAPFRETAAEKNFFDKFKGWLTKK